MTLLLYFDHNATAPLAPEVAQTFADALIEVPGNASSTHRFGQIARQRLEMARQTISRTLHCSPGELVFTSGGTESNNLAILGLVRDLPGTRKHVVATGIEHPAVLEPIRQLEREGADVTFVPVPPAGVVDPDEIGRSLRAETVLVSVMHANSETGAVQPIAEIAELLQKGRTSHRIYFHSDGVQALGKLEVDLDRLGVDLYSISAHKVHGPKGVGGLYVRAGTPLRGIQFGGRHERERRAGTENVPGAIAFARAVELLTVHPGKELAVLRDRFEERVLSGLANVEVNGSASRRLPNTSSILFHNVSGETLLIALDTLGFAVSTGSACSSGSIEPSHVLLAMGRTPAEARSSVRFSFGRFNTADEVDRLATAVIDSALRVRRSRERRSELVAH